MKRIALAAFAVLAAFAAAVAILRRPRPQLQVEEPSPERVVTERPLDTMTRDELYEVARDLDIPGRSKMKKSELREAVSRAERSG